VANSTEFTDRKFVVTTSRRANPAIRTQARQKAEAWELPYVERHEASMENSVGEADAIFVFDHDGLSLTKGNSRLRFNLGTAALRLKAIDRGEPDTLVRAGELQAGDEVLDATIGLGRDSLVAAHVVGLTGSVVGLESSWPLFKLLKEGFSEHDLADRSATVQPVFGDSRKFLAETKNGSFDVVILDPMFNYPKRSDGSFEILREFAHHTALDPEWIQLARRAAKRWVVLKADKAQPWFNSEKLERIHSGGRVEWYRAPPASQKSE